MDNKKIYIAPSSEVILLAPRENIMSWKTSGGNWWFKKDDSVWWGVKPADASAPFGLDYNWFDSVEEDPELKKY